MTPVFEAIEFAAHAHAGQYRKGTRIPYIVHPLAVATILIEADCRDDMVVGGLLHDVIEDTPVTLREVQSHFGDLVASYVARLTEPNRSHSWEERKQHLLDTLRYARPAVVMIQCADKLANIRDIRANLERDGADFWNRFDRGHDQQAWLYSSLAKIFLERLPDEPGASLAREFQSHVQAVFPPPLNSD